MSYIRIYSNKGNTIFKSNIGGKEQKDGLINVGKNPVFEINDGASHSRVILGFDLELLKEKLLEKTFTCNLKLYDAGTLRQDRTGLVNIKPINLFYFNTEFIEGDGFQFSEPDAISGYSNWNNRTVVEKWDTEFDTSIKTVQIQSKTDDLLFKNLESYINNSINNNLECNFAINLSTFDTEPNLFTKFIYSRHTKTIFQPYLEFFIDDVIIDQKRLMSVNKESSIYLVNQNFDQINNLEVSVQDLQTQNVSFPLIYYKGNGIHYYNYTPLTEGEFEESWNIDQEVIKKSMLTTKPNYNLENNIYSDLYFYPTTYYSKNLIRKGDVIKMIVVSRNKRKNRSFLSSDFEYKVVTTSDFELIPWQQVSLNNEELFFHIDTSFFYEEIEYEVFVRLKNKDRVQTSPDSYKFRVIYDGSTRFDNVYASPYSDRNIFLKR